MALSLTNAFCKFHFRDVYIDHEATCLVSSIALSLNLRQKSPVSFWKDAKHGEYKKTLLSDTKHCARQAASMRDKTGQSAGSGDV